MSGGKGGGALVAGAGVTTGVGIGAAAMLPVTGPNWAATAALCAALALVIWGTVYAIRNKVK